MHGMVETASDVDEIDTQELFPFDVYSDLLHVVLLILIQQSDPSLRLNPVRAEGFYTCSSIVALGQLVELPL